jgi:SIR2-like domain
VVPGSAFSVLEELRRAMKGRPLVVAGAGVSLSSAPDSALTWPELIEHGITYALGLGRMGVSTAEATRGLTSPATARGLVAAASQVEAILRARPGDFDRWLAVAVGRLEVENQAVIEALRRLPVQVATTNYDSMLSKHLGRQAVPWTRPALAVQVLRGEEPGVLHFHGVHTEPESVVFGTLGYERLGADVRAQFLQQVAGVVNTFIFVGCKSGVDDPNFDGLLSWLDRWPIRHSHFRLCTQTEVCFTAASVVDVVYGTTHAHLPGFLEQLAATDNGAHVVGRRAAERAKNDRRDDSQHDPSAGSAFPFVAIHGTRDAFTVPPAAYPALQAGVRRKVPVVCVGGVGTGKTTLAHFLARDFNAAFYVDLATASHVVDAATMQRGVHALASSADLLLIDNAHVSPLLARAAAETWAAGDSSSALAIFGRPDQRGRPPVELRQQLTVLVRPNAESFDAVARREIECALGRPHSSRELFSNAQLWRAEFAENLVLFEAAVQHALRNDVPGSGATWRVAPDEAVAYVAHELADASPDARCELLKLALLGELEIEAPRYLFRRADLELSLQAGFVQERHRTWTVHPGYASLMVSSIGLGDGTYSAHVVSLAKEAPELAPTIARRLLQRSDRQTTRDVVSTCMRRPDSLRRLLERQGWRGLEALFEVTARARGLKAGELEACVSALPADLLASAAHSEDPRVVFRFAARMEARAGDAPSGIAAFVATRQRSPVRTATKIALRTGDFALVADYLQRARGLEVAWQIGCGIADSDAADLISGLDSAGGRQLLLLLRAIRRAWTHQRRMHVVEARVVAALTSDAALATLDRWRAADTLGGARMLSRLPAPVARGLLLRMTDADLAVTARRLVESRHRRDLDDLVRAISVSSPDRVGALAAGTPADHHALARETEPLRAYLADHGPLAWGNYAIAHPTEEWRASDLQTVTNALTYATAVTDEERVRLLRDVIGPEVFDRWLRETGLRGRAHNLLHLWATQPPVVLRWLAQRRLLSRLPRQQQPVTASALGLYGVAALLGGPVPGYSLTSHAFSSALTRSLRGGAPGASTVLVVVGLLGCSDERTVIGTQAQWAQALTHETHAFERQSRYLALVTQIGRWAGEALPGREDRLEAIAAIADMDEREA